MDYLVEVHNYWLPTDWSDSVYCKMLASVQGQHPFNKWVVDIQSQNTLLRDTTLHLSDINLLYHLKSDVNSELAADYYMEGITKIELRQWIEKVWLLDKKHLCYLARQKDAVDAALHVE